MNFIVISFFVIATFFTLPSNGEIVPGESEEPKVLSLKEHESHIPNDNCMSGGEVLQESEQEVLIRNERGAKDKNNNNENNGSSSGKKGKPNKKDKNMNTQNHKQNNADTRPQTPEESCRYEKGAWSECTTGEMQRTDKLKTTTDPSCQATRTVNKNCNNSKSKDKKNKEERKSKNKENKDKGRKNRQ